MSTEGARSLLLAVLAVQTDLISEDQLVSVWRRHSGAERTDWGRLLVTEGVLAPEACDLLTALVDHHLASHGGDPEACLATLGSASALRARLLENVEDPEVRGLLASTQPAPMETVDQTAAAVSGAAPNSDHSAESPRFRILRRHARGGLGEVFLAVDTELNREVALKEIQDPFADDPGSRRRFVREAEITGRLEHPGIVPVYGLGHYRNGRPFYAMRFVAGDSLRTAIEQFHGGQWERPRDKAVAFRKLLGRFIDVCEAVAFAHSRGVLHRDLKPGNIMLGKFGETLVVDWGLAKQLQSPERAESAAGAAGPSRDSHEGAVTDDRTLDGSVLGTPAFMSPEQAAGKIEQLGAASDIYSLGATLYCLLTGAPPFPAGDSQLLENIQAGRFPKPRQARREVPEELEAVCLRAMSRDADQRHASAKELAEDIEDWLADRRVGDYSTGAVERIVSFCRRNVEWVAAAVIFLIVFPLWFTFLDPWRTDDGAVETLHQEHAALDADASFRAGADAWAKGDLPTAEKLLLQALAHAYRDQAQDDRSAGRLEDAERARQRIKEILRLLSKLSDARTQTDGEKH